MRRTAGRIITFLRCYQSLIVWTICVFLVAMTFFNAYVPGKWYIPAVYLGMFVNLYMVGKNGERYPLPGKFKNFATAVMVVSFIFACLNFFLCSAETKGSVPEIVDGAYALVNYDGAGTKFITEQEYHHLKCIEQRLWVGHSMIFYSFAMRAHCERKKESKS